MAVMWAQSSSRIKFLTTHRGKLELFHLASRFQRSTNSTITPPLFRLPPAIAHSETTRERFELVQN